MHLLTYLRSGEAFSQVFVTTQSPTALQHLEPEDLAMVRSRAGMTVVRPLDDPATLRGVLKSNPEAFLARRVIVTEGKTEYGLVLELIQEWDGTETEGSVPSAAIGVVPIEGKGGTGSSDLALELLRVGYEVVLFHRQ